MFVYPYPPPSKSIENGPARRVVHKVKDKELGDDIFADFIIKQTTKQEHINEILKSKGSSYWIGNVEVDVGIRPRLFMPLRKYRKIRAVESCCDTLSTI